MVSARVVTTRFEKRFMFLLLLVLGVGMTNPVMAGEQDKITAKARYETGSRFYDVQEYGKALEEYKAAYLAFPDVVFLFNIGQCYRKLGNNEKAAEFFRQFLKKTDPSNPNRASAEARLKDIENERDLKDVAKRADDKTKAETASPFESLQSAAPALPLAPETIGQPNASVDRAHPPTMLHQPAALAVSSPPPPPEPVQEPIYKTWWFWTGTGVVVISAVVTAVVLSSGGGTKIPHTDLGNQGAF